MLVMVRLPGMQGEELPQHLGGRQRPLMAAIIDADQHHTAVVRTACDGGGNQTADRGDRRVTPIHVAPERIQVRHRRTRNMGGGTGPGAPA